MSYGNVVDSKVVELSLNNQNFESNAKTSLSTIEKLKAALKLEKVPNGLENVRNDLLRLNTNTEVTTKGVGMLRRALGEFKDIAVFSMIADSAVKAKNSVEQFAKSLTIDQATAGWDKYGKKTEAVQTIMAATAKDFTDQGEQMKYVNEQLEKLNWFTDETSYSFLDMVNNIGKFTANNVKLDDAVTSMEGISTWAAISGAKVNEAGHAMYNLSQAIAVGSVKLMDWKSIENANMATAEFKQTAIDTAVELGTLTKQSDDLYKTLQGHEVSATNFNSALSDAWFTSDVLLKTLDKYGQFTNELYDALGKLGDSVEATDLLEYITKFKEGTLDLDSVSKNIGVSSTQLKDVLTGLSDETLAFGEKAFRAAQEAKTFEDAIEATKDAVSTGWMNTFEIMFGDYTRAKDLWTNLANDLYSVFASGGEARNDLLREAFNQHAAINEADWAKLTESGIAGPEFIKAIRESADAHGEVIGKMAHDETWLKLALKENVITAEDVNKAFQKVYKTGGAEVNEALKEQVEQTKETDKSFSDLLTTLEQYSAEDVSKVVFGDGQYNEGAEELERTLDQVAAKLGLSQEQGNELVTVLKSMGLFGGETANAFASMSDEQLKNIGWTQKQINALREAQEAGTDVDKVIKSIMSQHRTTGDIWFEGLKIAMHSVVDLVDIFREEWANVFPPTTASQLSEFIESLAAGAARFRVFINNSEAFKNGVRAVIMVINIAVGAISAFGKGVKNVATGLIKGLGINIEGVVNHIAGFIEKIHSFIQATDLFNNVAKTVGSVAQGVGWQLRTWFDQFTAIPAVQNGIERFKGVATGTFEKLGPYLKEGSSKLSEFASSIKKLGGIKLSNLGKVFKTFKNTIFEHVSKFPLFEELRSAVSDSISDVKAGLKEFGIDISGIEGIFGSLGTHISSAFSTVSGKVTEGLGKVKDWWGSFKESEIVTKNISRFKDGFSKFFGSFGPLVTGGIERVKGFIERVKEMGGLKLSNLKEVFGEFKDRVLGYFTNFKGFDGIKDAFSSLKTDIETKLRESGVDVDGFNEKINSIKTTVKGAFDWVINKVTELVDSFMNLSIVKKSIGRFSRAFKLIGADMGDFFKGIPAKVDEFVKKVEELGGLSLENIPEIFSAFTDTFGGYISEFPGFKALKTAFQGLWADIKAELKDTFGIDLDKIGADFQSFIDKITTSIQNFSIGDALAALPNILNDIYKAISGFDLQGEFSKIFGFGSDDSGGKTDPKKSTKNVEEKKSFLEKMLSTISGIAKVAIKYGPKIIAGVLVLKYIVGPIKSFFDTIGSIVKSFFDTIGSIGDALQGYSKFKSGQGFMLKMLGIAAFAGAIYIVAKALQEIAEIGDAGKIIGAIVTVAAISGVLLGVAKLASMIPAATVTLASLAAFFISFTAGLYMLQSIDFAGIANSIHDFITALGQINSEEIDKIDFSGLKSVVGLLGRLAAVGFVESVASIVTYLGEGKSSLSVLAEDMDDIATHLTTFIDSLSAIDQKKLDSIDFDSLQSIRRLLGRFAAVGVVESFASIVSYLGEGKSSLSVLAEDMDHIADGIDNFVTKISGLGEFADKIDYTGIQAVANSVLQISHTGFSQAWDDAFSYWLTGDSAVQRFVKAINGEEGEENGGIVNAISNFVTVLGEIGSFSDRIDFNGITTLATKVSQISSVGLTEAFADALTFAPATGVTTIERFTQSLDEIGQALVDWNDKVGELGKIDIHSEELNGLINAVKRIQPKGLGDAIAKFIDSKFNGDSVATFKEQVGNMADALNTWSTEMTGVTIPSTDVSTTVSNLVTAIDSVPRDSLWTSITEFFTGAPDFDAFETNITKLASAIKAFSTNLGSGFDASKVTSASAALSVLAEIGNTLKGQNFDSWTGDGDVSKFTKALNGEGGLSDAIKGFSELDIDVAKFTALSNASYTMSEMAAMLGRIDLSTGDIAKYDLVSTFQQGLAKLKFAIDSLADVDTTGVDKIVSATAQLAQAQLQTTVNKLLQLNSQDTTTPDMSSNGTAMADSLASGLSNSTAVSSALSTLTTNAAASIDTSSFSTKGAEIVAAIASGITSATDLITAVSTLVTGITGGVSSAISAAAEAIDVSPFIPKGKLIASNIGIGISTSTKISSAAKTTVKNAASAIDVSSFKGVGRNAATGFANGITENSFVARARARAMALQALNAAKEALDEHSPSKETAKIGKFFVLGFSNEVERGTSTVQRSSRTMAEAAKEGLSAAVDAMNMLISGDFDDDLVIRPVLDLTEIQNGSAQIGKMLNVDRTIPFTGNMQAINANMNSINQQSTVTNDDLLVALTALRPSDISSGNSGDVFNVDGITYDDGTNVADAVRTLVRAVNVKRRRS